MPEALKKRGVKPETFEWMRRYGWCSSMGQPLEWRFWSRARR